jgi:phosphoglycolate phosphatase
MSQAGLGSAGRSLSRPLSVRAVLFDLDGTLVDSAPDLTFAANKMLSALGYPPVNCSQVKGWVGDGVRSLVRRTLTTIVGDVPAESLIEQSYVLFQRYYAESVYQDSTLYPGVHETLQTLKSSGLALACVTNKPSRFTKPVLEKSGLTGFFGAVVSGDDLSLKKPDPAPLEFAAKQLGVPLTACVLVGDSINDIRAAGAAGIPVLWATYGYAGQDDIVQDATYGAIDTIVQLCECLQVAS